MNTKTNWATRAKAATAAIPLTKTAPKARGTRYEGEIKAVTAKAYKTGSFGIEFQYTLGGIERAVYENVVLSKQTEEGNLIPTQYGESTFKRRLQAAGFTSEQINAFSIPKTVKSPAEALQSLVGAPVAVYCIDEEYLGKPRKAVKSVWPLDGGADGGGAAQAA